MLGSANFQAGPLMAFMSGNLCYQIEHHLFPDLPSNRYAEIANACGRCATSTTCRTRRDPLVRQYCSRSGRSSSWRCPTGSSRRTADDAPETNSELKFRIRGGVRDIFGVDPRTGRRRGLRTALRELETAEVATA